MGIGAINFTRLTQIFPFLCLNQLNCLKLKAFLALTPRALGASISSAFSVPHDALPALPQTSRTGTSLSGEVEDAAPWATSDMYRVYGLFALQQPVCCIARHKSRTIEENARMSYLHSPYIKTGKISNGDLLHTLSVFIAEPIT